MLALYRRLAANAHVRRAVFAFVIALLANLEQGIIPWFHDLNAWLSSNGQTPFPSWHNLSFILASALVAGLAAVSSLVVSWIGVTSASSRKHKAA